MRHSAILLACGLAGPLALAACNSEPEVSARNATVEEVAEKVADAGGGESFLRAGKWVTKATIEEMSAPGMPAGVADDMIAAMANKPGTESCMTEADVKKPRADFFGGNENCRYDHFKMDGGEIDAKMRCTGGGGTQVMTMAGDYKPDEYRMRMTTETERPAGTAAGAVGSITMKMRVEGKRIGECDSKAG